MQTHNLIHHVRDYVVNLVFRKEQPEFRVIKKRDPIAGQRRQDQLEALCRTLFMKKELVASGRIQVLGLDAVKARMGRRWPGLRDVIYETCEYVIRKNVDPGDVFFRYQEKDFIILFENISGDESEAKMTMIASQIREFLFDDYGIEDVDVHKDVSMLSCDDIRKGSFFGKTISNSFESRMTRKRRASVPIPPISNKNEIDLDFVNRVDVAVAIPNEAPDLPIIKKEVPVHAVRYMPVWDAFKGRLIAFMCVLDRDDGAQVVAAHQNYYMGRSASDVAALDRDILLSVIQWFENHAGGPHHFGIICPVHFSTVSGIENAEKYRVLCQRINADMRNYVLFMVMDVPVHMPSSGLSQIVSPLKVYGRVLCGNIPLSGLGADLSALRISGFDNIGIVAGVAGRGNTETDLLNIRSLVSRSKRYLINHTFVLDADAPETVAEAIKAGVRYIAGNAVHHCVQSPDDKLHFKTGTFFQIWNNHMKDHAQSH